MNEYFSTSSPTYTDERFLQLSKKISKIQNLEIKSQNPLSNVEVKVDYLETNILRTIKDYEFKYNFLLDELNVLNKMVEDERLNKEVLKNKVSQELKNLELRIKKSFEIERENLKQFSNDLMKTIELEVAKIQDEINKEKEDIVAAIQAIKETVENEMQNFNENVDECIQNRQTQVNSVYEMVNEEMKYLINLVYYF